MAAFFSCFPVRATVQGLGEVYVVRELGRKFSRPTTPPFLLSHHPQEIWVIIWWGGLVGGTGGGEKGVLALTLAVSLWHLVDSLPGLWWDGTGLPG